MTPEIRVDSMNAAHRAFDNLQYGIIGGAALAEYGNIRTTNDLDVVGSR